MKNPSWLRRVFPGEDPRAPEELGCVGTTAVPDYSEEQAWKKGVAAHVAPPALRGPVAGGTSLRLHPDLEPAVAVRNLSR